MIVRSEHECLFNILAWLTDGLKVVYLYSREAHNEIDDQKFLPPSGSRQTSLKNGSACDRIPANLLIRVGISWLSSRSDRVAQMRIAEWISNFFIFLPRGGEMSCCSIAQTPVRLISLILKFRSICLLMAIIALLFLCSCTHTSTVVQATENHFYRSDDYIVYGLQDAESPEALAERFLGDWKKSWVIQEANPDVTFKRGQLIVIPLKQKNKGGLTAEGYQTVPILTYHRFADDCKSALCAPTRVFERQMEYLKENGYRAITPGELLSFLEYRQALPRKSVLITMDDGYRSVYDIAYPILKKCGLTATLFVYTSFVGVSGSAMTWDQLREMKANGFAIGSHTMFHSDLTKQKDGETELEFVTRIEKELRGSKEIIDRKLGQDTYFLAYPFGNYDQRAIEFARQAGYRIAMSVKRGGNPFFANPLSLRRDQILNTNMQIFISRLKTFDYLPLE